MDKFSVEEILERDKTGLDIFWIKDKSLANLDNLPAPEELTTLFLLGGNENDNRINASIAFKG
ncbi:MAG: hypothetical protein K2K90_11530 [Lachnospiraceae bacterium]|nr:hypothetical protein [Lachnospiraceae bacterium]